MLAGALVMALALAGCETMAPQPMSTIEETIEVSATVEKIDLANRLVSLKGQSGDVFTVAVDPLVRNLPQVKVGDRVVVRYREAIGASIATTSGQPVTIDLDGDVAEAGARPAGSISATTNVPVTITAVNTRTNTVSFFGQDGLVRALTVETPQAQAFIRQLKAGDNVIVSFTEAIALSVEPAP
jgi:hypothetical protein